MFNYYLFNKSYEKANSKAIEANLQDLNDLVVNERRDDDSFLKHDSIWYLPTADGEFGVVVFTKLEDKQLSNVVLPRMFNAIDSLENTIETFEQFDASFKLYNAFYGINFIDIDLTKCITDKTTYNKFREDNLWELTPESFWDRRKTLFSKIILCNSIEDDVKKIGGTYLSQILNKLKELDEYVIQYWKAGNFNYHDANEKAPLNISLESKKTMDQQRYYNQRVFSMPDGRKECFELHIKTGNLRFHFYPEGNIIYVGYIGMHLDTDRFN